MNPNPLFYTLWTLFLEDDLHPEYMTLLPPSYSPSHPPPCRDGREATTQYAVAVPENTTVGYIMVVAGRYAGLGKGEMFIAGDMHSIQHCSGSMQWTWLDPGEEVYI